MTPQPLLPALDAFRVHLTEHNLPEVVSCTVYGRGVSVQVARSDDSDAARNLLGWAQSLSLVRVTAWRPSSTAAMVHITVRGRTSSGLAVEVYAGVGFTPDSVGGDLEPGGHTDLTVDALRAAGGAS